MNKVISLLESAGYSVYELESGQWVARKGRVVIELGVACYDDYKDMFDGQG